MLNIIPNNQEKIHEITKKNKIIIKGIMIYIF